MDMITAVYTRIVYGKQNLLQELQVPNGQRCLRPLGDIKQRFASDLDLRLGAIESFWETSAANQFDLSSIILPGFHNEMASSNVRSLHYQRDGMAAILGHGRRYPEPRCNRRPGTALPQPLPTRLRSAQQISRWTCTSIL